MAEASEAGSVSPFGAPWWRELTRYHWWVLLVAALGWLFDTMDQQLFTLSRSRALDELLAVRVSAGELDGMTLERAVRMLGIPAKEAGGFRGVEVRLPGSGGQRGVLRLLPSSESAAAREYPLVGSVAAGPTEPVLVYPTTQRRDTFGQIATAILIAGWATGGLFFGIIGDKWGRAFTMMLTILIYSIFTGLSAVSFTWWDFTIYRFLTGMGVGGEFAAGVALVAEVMPDRARPYALGMLQALSAVGNMMGAGVGYVVLSAMGASWRYMYVVGILPALLVVLIRRKLKEPERWQAAKESAGHLVSERLGAFGDLFRQQPWRKHSLIGVVLVMSGVIGLWGVGFWTPELIRDRVLGDMPAREKDGIATLAFGTQHLGALFGIWAISLFSQGLPRRRALPMGIAALVSLGAVWATWRWANTYQSQALDLLMSLAVVLFLFFALTTVSALLQGVGRRGAFDLAFIAALASTFMVFGFMNHRSQIFWMVPMLGFFGLMVFGCYAMYLPELYPTRLRSTGTGFCYNVARYLATVQAPLMIAFVSGLQHFGSDAAFRFAAVTVAVVGYVVGLAVLPFAPETKDRPLPD